MSDKFSRAGDNIVAEDSAPDRPGATEKRIREKLLNEFNPTVFELGNESSRHHAPAGAESHFKLLMVSPVFTDLARLKRQQKVYDLLKDELAGPIHAFTMKLMSPEEWERLPPEEKIFKAIGHHSSGRRRQ